MGWLGTFILLFLVIHLKDFWTQTRFTKLEDYQQTYNGVQMIDLFRLMQDTFTNAWVVLLYLIGCLSLAFHLMHGFQSAFRSLGVHNSRYIRLVKGIGYGFAIIVPLAFAMMPVSMYFNWV
jgi:succinate dehydrogenase / fumarate reductase cytochrome b subunit